jgi:hypothetical protein
MKPKNEKPQSKPPKPKPTRRKLQITIDDLARCLGAMNA